jgi:hypothetical protein
MRAASGVVAEFVDEENAEQGERVGKTREEESGVAEEPAPGPKITLARDGRKTAEEVVHELRAVHGGGDDAGKEKQQPANHIHETTLEAIVETGEATGTFLEGRRCRHALQSGPGVGRLGN